MIYQSRTIFENDPRFPGVRITLRKISTTLRERVETDISALRGEIRDLQFQYADLISFDTDSDEAKKAKAVKRAALDRYANSIANRGIKAPWIRACVVKIEGLEIDAGDGPVPATVDLLIDEAHEDLVDACYQRIMEASSLSAREQGESQPPSISSAPEKRPAIDSSAESAGPAETTGTSETAPDMLPSL